MMDQSRESLTIIGNMERLVKGAKKGRSAVKNDRWKYAPEVVVFIVGVVISVLSYIWFSDAKSAFLCVIITSLSDSIILSVQIFLDNTQKGIANDVKKQFEESYLDIGSDVARVNGRWRRDVDEEIKSLRGRIKSMADGVRAIASAEAIQYQASLLEETTQEVLAIHLGESQMALERWDKKKTGKDFTKVLIDANEKCKAMVKRRLFVIEDSSGYGYLNALKIALETQATINFEAKVISKKAINDQGLPYPKDILICDKAEVVAVEFRGGQVDATAYTSEEELNRNQKWFATLWSAARIMDKEELERLVENAKKADKKKK